VNADLDPTLVVTALSIAVLALHVAVRFIGRMAGSRGRTRVLWWLGGATGMGVGTWSMHFVATLALRAPSEIHYDVPVLLATVLVAIAVSALALQVRSRPVLPVYALVMASLLMGAAISGMRTDGAVAATEPAVSGDGRSVSPHIGGVSIAAVPGMLLILGLGFTIAAIDARERLLAREQRVRQEIESASRLKDEFLATLSHELRTPLNIVLGRTRMLPQAAHDEASVRALTDAIERNGAVLARLVEDLLDVSAITLGHVRLQMQPVRLSDLLTISVQGVQPSAHVKGIALTVIGSDPGTVKGDPTRLQQIIWNLLTNAIKFTPKGGSVEVRLASDDTHVELTVRDTGIGLSPEFAPFVFDRFRQADDAASRRFGGLGLGLAIVRHIAELHGGRVRAESPGEGRGSTFTLTLPLADKQVLTATDPIDADADVDLDQIPSLEGVKVLLVEDNHDSLDMLVLVLATRSAEVRTATSAREGLATLTSWLPDVLISDIGLPGEDGLWLMRSVRALEPERGGRTPAVAVTAFARPEDRTKSLLAGFQQHMVKPVEPAELCAVVASLAGRT
jgi:signal transduction histidine kinase/CheY-like chemotaxis protein